MTHYTSIAALSTLAYMLVSSPLAGAQGVHSEENGQIRFQPDNLNPNPLISHLPIDRPVPPRTEPIPCESVRIESSDPWIRTVDLSSRLLATPEFVNGGIAIAPDVQHADLVLQFSFTNDDETRIEYLTASNGELNLWDRISFLWPSTNYDDVITAKVLKMVVAHCVPRGDDHPALPKLLPQLVNQKLSAVRSMRPVVRTSWMRDEVLLSALKARPEFAAWGIKIRGANDPSDCDLIVGHLINTLTWNFRILDSETGVLLREGTVMAFHDERAASKLAAEIVEQIAKLRPLPASTPGPRPSRETVEPGAIDVWEVVAVSEDMKRKFPGKMHLFIKDGIITVTDLEGATLFLIPGKSLVDFADTNAYYTFGDEIRESVDNGVSCDPRCFVMLPYGVILLTLDQFHVPLHILEIAWAEDNTLRTASLRVSKGDYQRFLWNLEFLSKSQTNDSP